MKPIRSLAFFVNADKAGAIELESDLAATARRLGVRIKSTARFPLPRGYLRGWDACCVIGGDGTLLGAVEQSAAEQVPIIGVNRGSLGFLTTVSADEARRCLPELLKGDFIVEMRAMLSCAIGRAAGRLALNDVLIKDEINSRIIHLEVTADGGLVTDYQCDGLIFSTATGSTAYNLSAGGPIIHPGADVIAMTPICPHTLTNRSIIFRDSVRLRVENRSRNARLLVSLDGHRAVRVGVNAPVAISVSPIRLPLVQRNRHSYFSVVRTKLKWSGGVAQPE